MALRSTIEPLGIDALLNLCGAGRSFVPSASRAFLRSRGSRQSTASVCDSAPLGHCGHFAGRFAGRKGGADGRYLPVCVGTPPTGRGRSCRALLAPREPHGSIRKVWQPLCIWAEGLSENFRWRSTETAHCSSCRTASQEKFSSGKELLASQSQKSGPRCLLCVREKIAGGNADARHLRSAGARRPRSSRKCAPCWCPARALSQESISVSGLFAVEVK